MARTGICSVIGEKTLIVLKSGGRQVLAILVIQGHVQIEQFGDVLIKADLILDHFFKLQSGIPGAGPVRVRVAVLLPIVRRQRCEDGVRLGIGPQLHKGRVGHLLPRRPLIEMSVHKVQHGLICNGMGNTDSGRDCPLRGGVYCKLISTGNILIPIGIADGYLALFDIARRILIDPQRVEDIITDIGVDIVHIHPQPGIYDHAPGLDLILNVDRTLVGIGIPGDRICDPGCADIPEVEVPVKKLVRSV